MKRVPCPETMKLMQRKHGTPIRQESLYWRLSIYLKFGCVLKAKSEQLLVKIGTLITKFSLLRQTSGQMISGGSCLLLPGTLVSTEPEVRENQTLKLEDLEKCTQSCQVRIVETGKAKKKDISQSNIQDDPNCTAFSFTAGECRKFKSAELDRTSEDDNSTSAFCPKGTTVEEVWNSPGFFCRDSGRVNLHRSTMFILTIL